MVTTLKISGTFSWIETLGSAFNIWSVWNVFWVHHIWGVQLRTSHCWTRQRLDAWWRHQMETFSALLALCAKGIYRSPVYSPHKGQWRRALMFPLICAWMNSWVINRETGDLRRHRAHNDVIVMATCIWPKFCCYNLNSWKHSYCCNLINGHQRPPLLARINCNLSIDK